MILRLRARLAGTTLIRNVFRRDPVSHSRLALFSYLVRPFYVASEDDPELLIHSQWWQNRQIARLLDQRGYRVDVVNHDDDRFTGDREYDLVLGMGQACLRTSRSMPPHTVRIYIMTGAESGFNNDQEQRRLEAVRQRRGCVIQPRRLARMDSKELGNFDGVACFGNEFNAALCRPFHPRPVTFNNCGVPGIRFLTKDYEKARSHFLYLASFGQVHKGLDLLLEAFAALPDCHLHICTTLRREPDFVACYRRELYETPNIHVHGWTSIGSRRFHDLCRTANCAVSASCAEASAGAIVVAMHAGLIPLVSRECGIDTDDFGLTLDSCEINEIRRRIAWTAGQSASWHERQSHEVRDAALRDYSQESFTRRWNEILDNEINRKVNK